MKPMATLLLVLLISAGAYGQDGALAVSLQGSIFDRGEPPEPAVPVLETGGLGPQLVISPASDAGFNLALFTENSTSMLFKMFRYPGRPIDANGVRIPPNAFVFFGTLQDGNVAADLLVFSGAISATDSKGPQNVLYTGSLDNPVILAPDTAPVYSWDFIQDGVVGNGDNLACQQASGPSPRRGFIAIVERGKCSFSVKAQNAAQAGAIAIIVFNHEDGGDTFITNMTTPGVNIPSLFIRRGDGLDLVRFADDNRNAPARLDLFPENLLGTITGTYRVRDGALESVNLNLTIGNQGDFIFSGTVNR